MRGICSAAWVGCYNGVLSNVVVFKEWSGRESADMYKRAHNRYATCCHDKGRNNCWALTTEKLYYYTISKHFKTLFWHYCDF